jgi:hypothetical protein
VVTISLFPVVVAECGCAWNTSAVATERVRWLKYGLTRIMLPSDICRMTIGALLLLVCLIPTKCDNTGAGEDSKQQQTPSPFHLCACSKLDACWCRYRSFNW